MTWYQLIRVFWCSWRLSFLTLVFTIDLCNLYVAIWHNYNYPVILVLQSCWVLLLLKKREKKRKKKEEVIIFTIFMYKLLHVFSKGWQEDGHIALDDMVL